MRWLEKSPYTPSLEMIKEVSNLAGIAPCLTLVLYENVNNALQISSENDDYTVFLRASAYKWLNKSAKPCRDKDVSLAGLGQAYSLNLHASLYLVNNDTCKTICDATLNSSECNCLKIGEASLIRQDNPDLVCSKSIYLIRDNCTFHTGNCSALEAKQNQTCARRKESRSAYDECLKSCVPACQTWKYEQVIQIGRFTESVRKVGKKNGTKIRIEYPLGNNDVVVMMTESDAQQWENFVGNVGGILGIWTGASIVSFIQTVYLCFCETSGCGKRRRLKKAKISRVNIPVVNKNIILLDNIFERGSKMSKF